MKDRDFMHFIKKNYQYFAVGLLFIILVVVLATASGESRKKSGSDKKNEKGEQQEEEIEVPDTPLEKDSNPAVNDLLAKYFTAMGEGDSAALESLCSELGEKEKLRIEKKAEFIDSYTNLECYTKTGPKEGEYIVFGYYEIKFKNIDTMVPGLSSLYVRSRDDGSLYVYNSELDESTGKYLKAIYAQDDVKELFDSVDKKYKEALESDETLKSFMEALPTALEDAVNAELAAKEENPETGGALPEGTRAGVKENINVRKGPGTDSDKLGQLLGGDSVPVLEIRDDGWSKIDFNGQEAYVKTEFLDMPSTTGAGTDTPAPEPAADAGQAEGGDNEAQTGGNDAGEVKGKVEAKEAVSIRRGAGTDSEKVGSAYKGDKFDYLGEEGEWTKIKYNGQTAYIKSEFVSKI